MNRTFARGCIGILTVLALMCAGRAEAQDAAKPQAPATPQPLPTPAEPESPAWHGSLSLSMAFANGIQEQKNVGIDGDLERPFSDGGRFVVNASRQYQKVTFPTEAALSNRTNIAIGADQNTTKYTVAMIRSLYLQDPTLLVNSRYEELFGYGLHYYDKTKKKTDFTLVPGFSVYKENLSYADASGWTSAFGFFEKFSGHVNKAWSVGNAFRFRKDFSDAHRSIESSASVEGQITKTLGMQIGYQYNYESIVPSGFPNYLSLLSAGLKFQF